MVPYAGRLSCRRAWAVRRFPGPAVAQAENPKLISVVCVSIALSSVNDAAASPNCILSDVCHDLQPDDEMTGLRLSDIIGNVINQAFRVFPSQAWIGNGFSVDALPDFLAAFLNVTFYHDSFYQLADIRI